MLAYSVSVAFLYRVEDGSLRERSLEAKFTSETPVTAARDAIRWAITRFKVAGESMGAFDSGTERVGSLKLHQYLVNGIDAEGNCGSRYGQGTVLEWQHDTGLKGMWNDATLLSLVRELAALTPADFRRPD